MGTHPIFESDFDCLTALLEMDENSDELQSRISNFDQWVTSLVDLIPTSIYIPTDVMKNATTEKFSNAEKRRRRLDPDTCLTTSMKALMTIEEGDEEQKTIREDVRPSELKEKFDAKLAEIRANQKRDLPRVPRTVEEQRIVSEKRKAERERKKAKKSKVKKIKDEAQSGSRSPAKEVKEENGKVIFNKFDLVKDPVEAEKERIKKKIPIQIRLKQAEAKKARIEEMEETNPEKAKEMKEQKQWKDAMTRMKGEKVRDDAGLLKKSLKRMQQKKAASTKKWGERTEKVAQKMEARQQKRKENLKARGQKKGDKSGPKKKKKKTNPG